jgi:ADP-ribose pyrophosphatase YjhB (NUDIX family)
MDKFSSLKMEKDVVPQDTSKFKNDDFSVIGYDESDIILSKDEMIILPYLRDDGFILMKYQKTPAFNYKYKEVSSYQNTEHFLACIKGFVNEKENEIQNVRRILHDETGLVLSTNSSIEVDKILFKNDVNVGQYHFCLLNLSYNDYKQTSLKTNDFENRVIKISLGDLDEIKSYDLITDYMIMKIKYDLKF